MQRLNYYLLLLLLGTCAKVNAQIDTAYSPDKTYTQNQLLADFGILHDVLIEAHPSLYRYQTKAHFDSLLTKAKDQITGPMTGDEFWRVLMPIIVSIRSGHTSLVSSQADAFWHAKNTVNSLPAPLVYLNNDSLFISNRFRRNVPPNFRPIISINGVKSEEIVNTLRNYTSGEGLSNQFADSKLTVFNLPQLYGKIYGYSTVYHLELVDKIGTKIDTAIRALPSTFSVYYAGDFRHYLENKKKRIK